MNFFKNWFGKKEEPKPVVKTDKKPVSTKPKKAKPVKK